MNGHSIDSHSMDPLAPPTKKESFQVEPNNDDDPQPSQTPLGFLQSLYALIVAYALYYRGVTSIILVATFMLAVVIGLDSMASNIASKKFHHLSRDYSPYSPLQLKTAQIDHWCLQVSTYIL